MNFSSIAFNEVADPKAMEWPPEWGVKMVELIVKQWTSLLGKIQSHLFGDFLEALPSYLIPFVKKNCVQYSKDESDRNENQKPKYRRG